MSHRSNSSILAITICAGVLALPPLATAEDRLTAAADTTMGLSAQPSGPAVFGQPVELTATVTSGSIAATGAVQFSVDGAGAGAPVPLDATGIGRRSFASLEPGSHVLTATYQPSGGFQGTAPQSLTQVVEQSETSTSVTVEPDPSVAGHEALVTVAVRPRAPGAGKPTGEITLSDDQGGIPETFALDDDGTVNVPMLGFAGAHHLSAAYHGDTRFRSSSGAVAHSVRRARTTTTLTSSRNPVPVGQLFDLTAEVAIEPGGAFDAYGTLQFTVDGAPLGPQIPLEGAIGVVVTVRAPNQASTGDIGVNYSGDMETEPSSASLTQVVAAPPVASNNPTPTSTTAPVIVNTAPIKLASTRSLLTRMVSDLLKSLKERGLAGVATVTQSLSAPTAGTVVQRIMGAAPGRKPVLLASGARSATAAGPTSLRLRLTAQGRALTRRSGKVKLAIISRFKPTSGATVTLTNRATVKARVG